MLEALLPYPQIDPVFFSIPIPFIGALPIRWYALAYIAGLLGGLIYARALVRRPALWGPIARPEPYMLDDLLFYAALGTILGGRLGMLLFAPEFYFAHPFELLKIWEGGMAFHGGLLGVTLGIWLFARKYALSFFTIADICAVVVPIGLFFGRIANFIRPELWGRPSSVPWAMVFPSVDTIPRHPSQLYEAGLEGLALFVILGVFARNGAFQRPGFLAGLFGILYGVARIISEFFRQPDATEELPYGLTKGMLFSLPLIIFGCIFVIRAIKQSHMAKDQA